MKSVLTQHRTQQKRTKIRKFLSRFGIVFILIGGCVLFLLMSPWFRFESLVLSGNVSIPSEEIMRVANNFLSGRVVWFFPRRGMFVFRPGAFESYILKEFPKLSAADVSRSFSRELILHVREHSSWGLYCKTNADDCFYISQDGVLVASAPQLTGNSVFRITDQRTVSAFYILGEQVIEESDAVFLHQVIDLLADRYQVTIREVVLGRVFQDQTELLTNEGWYALVDKHTDKDRALENLTLVLDKHITNRVLLEYIDIRFENKVFYKNK